MGVANQQVVVRAIDLPWVEPDDLKQSLPYLVRDVLPLPVDQAVLDFLPLDPTPTRGEPIHGLLVASPRESIATMVRCAERAGLRPTAVDLTSFALLRAVARGQSGGSTEALVDIGATVTNIVVHEWGIPRVVRIVLRGGADLTAVLSDRLGISNPEAEDLKRRDGMSSTNGETATLVRLAVTPLIEELRSSLDYFTAIHGGARVDRIRLCGGGSLLPGLRAAVEERLHIKTELTDPMVDLLIRGKNLDSGQVDLFRPLSAVPIGLALGAA
jgi:type IV pilus assembly protein PilM